jgi:hypothetical protein
MEGATGALHDGQRRLQAFLLGLEAARRGREAALAAAGAPAAAYTAVVLAAMAGQLKSSWTRRRARHAIVRA